MTNREAIRLLEESRETLNGIPGFSLNKAIVEAEIRLDVILKTIEKMVKVPESLQAERKDYNKELEAINLKYCLKENGKPVTVKEQLENGKVISKYQFGRNKPKRDKAVDVLDDKFKDTIASFIELEKKKNDLLKEESGYKPTEIDEKMIHKGVITEQMRVLYKLFIVK